MLSAALAMLVCGCLSVLVPREKIPSIAETFTMCLSRPGARSISGLQPGAQDEGRHRVHELDLEHLGGGHLGEGQPPGVLLPQVHLLQVGVDPPVGEEVAAPRGVVVGVAHLRQLRRGRDPDAAAAAVPGHEAGGVDALAGRQRASCAESAPSSASWLASRPAMPGGEVGGRRATRCSSRCA